MCLDTPSELMVTLRYLSSQTELEAALEMCLGPVIGLEHIQRAASNFIGLLRYVDFKITHNSPIWCQIGYKQ